MIEPCGDSKFCCNHPNDERVALTSHIVSDLCSLKLKGKVPGARKSPVPGCVRVCGQCGHIICLRLNVLETRGGREKRKKKKVEMFAAELETKASDN